MAIVSKWCEVPERDARSYLILVNGEGRLEGRVYGTGGEEAAVVSDEVVPVDAGDDGETPWVHVALERDHLGELSLWVNRTKQQATADAAFEVLDTDEAFRIGAAGNVEEGEHEDGMYFVGLIDEVRFSKTARGAAGKLCKVEVNYSYNARNQLVTETSGASTKTYSYDKNGNTTGIVEKVGAVQVASVAMTYDALNRMTSYAGPEGTESFGYRGAEWHRFSADGTSFLYDGDNVLADISTGISRLYVTPFLDQNLSLTINAGDLAGTYYYSQDGLGSVRTLADSTGSLKNKYDYTPFGQPFAPGTSVTVKERYTYTGRGRNRVLPFGYNRHRYYDPAGGRFGSRDPLLYNGSEDGNLYTYLSNKPLLSTDPFGLARSTKGSRRIRHGTLHWQIGLKYYLRAEWHGDIRIRFEPDKRCKCEKIVIIQVIRVLQWVGMTYSPVVRAYATSFPASPGGWRLDTSAKAPKRSYISSLKLGARA